MSAPRDPRLVARRRLLGASVVPLGLAVPPAAAQPGARAPTPSQTRGPFYPPAPPPDAGEDLVLERGGRRAGGELLRLSGRVVDTGGRPLAGTRVELWQCNAAGRYHHPRDDGPAPLDPLFLAYGRSTAGTDGGWRFRTIRPVAYPGRTPHLHLLLTAPDGRSLSTQLYVRGEPGNARDGLLSRLAPEARERLMADVVRGADGAWQAAFEVVLPV
jgi:protocatechuate 3,4-dioxygenase beta subunit